MFKCNDCGCSFEKPDTTAERSEYFGATAIEYRPCCPNCKSDDIERTIICQVCGEPSKYDICENCERLITTERKILKYGEANREEIKLNPLYIGIMSVEEIETVLAEYLKRTGKYEQALDELKNSDYGDYIDWLKKQ